MPSILLSILDKCVVSSTHRGDALLFQGHISVACQTLTIQPLSQPLRLILPFLKRRPSQVTLLLGVQFSVSMPQVKLLVMDSSIERPTLDPCAGVINKDTMHLTPAVIVSHNMPYFADTLSEAKTLKDKMIDQ